MRITRLPEAERNIRHQVEYIAERNPRAAIALGAAIDAAILRLADHPRSGRLGRLQGTRELVVAGTPFVIVYRVEESEVVILRVVHGAQRWPPQGARVAGNRRDPRHRR